MLDLGNLLRQERRDLIDLLNIFYGIEGVQVDVSEQQFSISELIEKSRDYERLASANRPGSSEFYAKEAKRYREMAEAFNKPKSRKKKNTITQGAYELSVPDTPGLAEAQEFIASYAASPRSRQNFSWSSGAAPEWADPPSRWYDPQAGDAGTISAPFPYNTNSALGQAIQQAAPAELTYSRIVNTLEALSTDWGRPMTLYGQSGLTGLTGLDELLTPTNLQEDEDPSW